MDAHFGYPDSAEIPSTEHARANALTTIIYRITKRRRRQDKPVHKQPGISPLTVAVAKTAFPNGNLAMPMRDELGTVYTDGQFRDLFAERGQPAESPAKLVLVIVLQFAEGLTDR